MKLRLLPLALALNFAACLPASAALTIQFAVVSKDREYDQTGAGLANVNADGTPYKFEAQITGGNTSDSFPAPANTLTPPGGSAILYTSPSSNGSSEWRLSGATGFADQASMDAAFPNGTYALSFNNGGTPANQSVSLLGDLYPNIPFVSSNQLFWSGGVLLVNPNMDLTLTTSVFSGNFSSGLSRVSIGVDNGSNDVDNSASGFTTNTLSATFAAGSLTLGSIYTARVQFNRFSDDQALLGGQAVAIYTANTNFTIRAVPEPAETAAIIGAVVMGCALLMRWRKIACS